MIKETPSAIVLGDHVQALGIVRSLGRRGLDVSIVSNRRIGIAHHSKYSHAFFKTSYLPGDPNFDKELKKICEKFSGAVIFPTTDNGVKALMSAKKSGLDCIPAIPNEMAINTFLSKLETYRLAEHIDVLIPPYSDENADMSNLKFPVVLRPDDMQSFNSIFRKKMFQANNQNELKEKIKFVKAKYSKSLLIQEKIPNAHLHLYSFCALCKDGKVLVGFTGKRLRQHPKEFGSASTLVELVHIPQLEDLGERILSAVDYTGVAEVEFIYDQRKEEYLLTEVNPRFWKWHTISLAIDLDLPFLLFKLLMQGKIPEDYRPKRALGVWCDTIADIPVLLRYGRYSRVKKDVIKINAVAARDDLQPFVVELIVAPLLSVGVRN